MELYFATGNPHKLAEANSILSKFGVLLRHAPSPKIEIQSESLEEIARYAAEVAYRSLGSPLVVEDSGLFVESLNGFPGPYSSYVYKTIGCGGILRLLEGNANREARFECVVVYASGETLRSFVGIARGSIAEAPRGSGGFGFDPIFISDGCGGKTFSELGPSEKSAVSHRGRAFRALGEWLRSSGRAYA
ncbi:MAG: XTP/dITP diphosphatase [Candidatus Methanosuratincola sp.]|nr:XTP/dITP diphosphatase [Candidatus Methanosuratincola sp.]